MSSFPYWVVLPEYAHFLFWHRTQLSQLIYFDTTLHNILLKPVSKAN